MIPFDADDCSCVKLQRPLLRRLDMNPIRDFAERREEFSSASTHT